MRVSTLTFLLVISIFLSGVSCTTYLTDPERAEGEDLVAKIEDFREDKGRLPENLTELGIEERLEGPVFYEKISGDSYEVWYGTSLGESSVYNSGDREWKPFSRKQE